MRKWIGLKQMQVLVSLTALGEISRFSKLLSSVPPEYSSFCRTKGLKMTLVLWMSSILVFLGSSPYPFKRSVSNRF
jgi:hypothetical protein